MTTVLSCPPVTAPSPAGSILESAKARQRIAWGAGDYAIIGTTLQIVGESLCEAADVHAGEQVLDVACGNGNATLAAARRLAGVTGLDYVPALLDLGRARAEAERLPISWREGDAEALPFVDHSFDLVLSTFGVMFTPNQDRAAAEMLRVCRPGGRIALANWTPEGFIGQLFRLLGSYLPPPAGLRSPAQWGTEARLRELFPGVGLQATRRHFVFRYHSPRHFIEVFRAYYGPVQKAFEALPADRQEALDSDIFALLQKLNQSGDATLALPSEYLEVVLGPTPGGTRPGCHQTSA